MAGNDLRIKITGTLNTGASINEINASIKGIEKKINKLKLNIQIDEKVINTLNNFSKQMQKIGKSAFNPDGSGFTKTFNDINRQSESSKKKQLSDIEDVSRGFDKLTKKVQNYNAAQKKTSETNTFSDKDGITSRTVKSNGQGQVVGYTDTYNAELMRKQLKKTADEEKQMIEQMAKFREQSTLRRRQEEQKLASAQARAINQNAQLERQEIAKSHQSRKAYEDWWLKAIKNREVAESKASQKNDNKQLEAERRATETLNTSKNKLRQTLSQLNTEGKVSAENLSKLNRAIDNSKNIQQVQKLEANLKNLNRIRENEHKLDMARQQSTVNSQRLQTTHGGYVDRNALTQYQQSINDLTPRTANLNQQLQRSSQQFSQVAQNARTAAGAAQQAGMSFGEMMTTALKKFPIWMISATLFYAPIRALQDMSARLLEIDTLLTDINRVMDIPDFKLTEMLNDAIVASDELSGKLTDMLRIMGDFGRMGFEQGQLLDISKTATVMQNISDLDAKASVDTLTSAMLNFNISAKDSIKIVDQLNEVDNNFAISTKDLSDGLRKSASTAKTFGVDMQTLVGYIAAIGRGAAA